MQRFIISSLVLVAATLPASADPHRHRVSGHPRDTAAAGVPITAEPDSIRINAVGQVISQPVPVIDKERKIDTRIQRELDKPVYNQMQGKPAAPQQP